MAKVFIKSQNQNYGGELLQNMQMLQDDGELCDVVLIAAMDGQRFSCHRLVLAAGSLFFKALFTSPMRESQQNEITLGEVYGDQLMPLLNFCYTGSMELQADMSVKELLCTASLLQLDAAIVACADFLEKQMSPANCLGTFALAEQYNLNGLKSVAEKYIGEQFAKLCQNEEFLQLSLTQLSKLIASDDLNVTTEEAVFASTMAWVQHDSLERSKHIPELLKLVRLPFLPPAFLAKHVRPICIEHGCQQLLLDVFIWQSVPEERIELSPRQTEPRKSESADLLAVFESAGALNIDRYCRTADAWSSFGRIDPGRTTFAAAILNNKLIIVGGYYGITLDTVQSFDLKSKTSTQLAQMLAPRTNLGLAVLDGQLYAVGGGNGSSSLNTVERYDPIANTWTSVAPMTVAREALGVAVLGGRLYAVGGLNNLSYFSSTECYDPRTNQWTPRASMFQARNQHGFAAGRDFLYAVGGRCGGYYLTSLERYDPRVDKWTQLCNLSVAQGPVGCTFIGERLLAFSGVTDHVEEYNVDTDSWIQRKPLRQTMPSLKVVLVPKLT